jgi:hypothetical protein
MKVNVRVNDRDQAIPERKIHIFSSLRLHNFRAFHDLTVSDLARVNLFVGQNGCGKTSVLEAAALLVFGAAPAMLLNILCRRGEVEAVRDKTDYLSSVEVDVSHLFYRHRVEAAFEIIGGNGDPREIRGEITSSANIGAGRVSKALSISCNQDGESTPLAMSDFGGIIMPDPWRNRTIGRDKRVCLVPVEGLTRAEMSRLWNDAQLGREEEEINNALRVIEPDLDRIAFPAGDYGYLSGVSEHAPAGVRARMKSTGERVPLGSLGDGVTRLLGLLLAVSVSSQGFAMIDEIDTGLHFSIMRKMWEMVIEIAERLDVQVFATTHSLDCLNGLANLQREKADRCKSVRVFRIEKDLEKAIPFSAAEILIADEHRFEVR